MKLKAIIMHKPGEGFEVQVPEFGMKVCCPSEEKAIQKATEAATLYVYLFRKYGSSFKKKKPVNPPIGVRSIELIV